VLFFASFPEGKIFSFRETMVGAMLRFGPYAQINAAMLAALTAQRLSQARNPRRHQRRWIR
jgi:hypothetical protein